VLVRISSRSHFEHWAEVTSRRGPEGLARRVVSIILSGSPSPRQFDDAVGGETSRPEGLRAVFSPGTSSQPFSRSYGPVLPSSLGRFVPLGQRFVSLARLLRSRVRPSDDPRDAGVNVDRLERLAPRRGSGSLREVERTSPASPKGRRHCLAAACFSGRTRSAGRGLTNRPRGVETRESEEDVASRTSLGVAGRIANAVAGSGIRSVGARTLARFGAGRGGSGPLCIVRCLPSRSAHPTKSDLHVGTRELVDPRPFRTGRRYYVRDRRPRALDLGSPQRSRLGRTRRPPTYCLDVVVGRRVGPTGSDRSVFGARGFGGWVVTHSLADADFHGHRPAVVTLSRP